MTDEKKITSSEVPFNSLFEIIIDLFYVIFILAPQSHDIIQNYIEFRPPPMESMLAQFFFFICIPMITKQFHAEHFHQLIYYITISFILFSFNYMPFVQA